MESTPILSSSIPLTLSRTNGAEVSKAAGTFSDVLASTLEKVSDADIKGNQSIMQLQTGEANSIHEVMIAVEEADMAIRMLVQMRNKALEAYNEIMRLQI